MFRGIIERFGSGVRAQLQAALQDTQDPLPALEALGPALLRFTTDEHAIIMNRAAVIDAAETGVLARAIDEVARDAIFPLIVDLMQRLVDSGAFAEDVLAADAAQSYVSLLFGEVQLRRRHIADGRPGDAVSPWHRRTLHHVLKSVLIRT